MLLRGHLPEPALAHAPNADISRACVGVVSPRHGHCRRSAAGDASLADHCTSVTCCRGNSFPQFTALEVIRGAGRCGPRLRRFTQAATPTLSLWAHPGSSPSGRSGRRGQLRPTLPCQAPSPEVGTAAKTRVERFIAKPRQVTARSANGRARFAGRPVRFDERAPQVHACGHARHRSARSRTSRHAPRDLVRAPAPVADSSAAGASAPRRTDRGARAPQSARFEAVPQGTKHCSIPKGCADGAMPCHGGGASVSMPPEPRQGWAALD
jgi:hypothetical protein